MYSPPPCPANRPDAAPRIGFDLRHTAGHRRFGQAGNSVLCRWVAGFEHPRNTARDNRQRRRGGADVAALPSSQWHDVVGVIKVQGDALDRAYLLKWARDLGLEELLARALSDGGLT